MARNQQSERNQLRFQRDEEKIVGSVSIRANGDLNYRQHRDFPRTSSVYGSRTNDISKNSHNKIEVGRRESYRAHHPQHQAEFGMWEAVKNSIRDFFGIGITFFNPEGVGGKSNQQNERNEETMKKKDAEFNLGPGTNRFNGGNKATSRETAANGSSGGAGTMGSVVNAGTSESEGTARKKIH
jgi:hypothetical protein